MLTELGGLLLLGLGVLIWWRFRETTEGVYRATRRHCEAMDLQLLDDSLVLSGLKLKRRQGGWPALVRCYRFEFSATGAERYQGEVVTLGRRIQRIELPPYRETPEA